MRARLSGPRFGQSRTRLLAGFARQRVMNIAPADAKICQHVIVEFQEPHRPPPVEFRLDKTNERLRSRQDHEAGAFQKAGPPRGRLPMVDDECHVHVSFKS